MQTPKTASTARLWLFRLSSLFLAPLAVIACLELGLRILGTGYPSSFTIACEVGGVTARCDNPSFTWQFFPRRIARTPPSFAFAEPKPQETVRIFLVGGSAAQGDPEPLYGVGRILRVLLEERFPGVRFELINAAITAINSHVVLPIVRDLSRHDGDLFIVYLGNNEVVGPFGAGTIFSPISKSRSTIRIGVFLRSTRLGQLIADALGGARGQAEQEWRGMEMFLGHRVSAADSRLPTVYAHFRGNLADIVELATDSGAGVILASVGTNLKDCAPFASSHREDLTEEEASLWQRLFDEGRKHESAARLDEASESYARAEQVDGDFAELHYRLGRARLASGKHDAASSSFVASRDLDTLRFRADRQINEIIREVGLEHSPSRLRFVDTEELFESHDPAGIPGDELFFDHVHMSFTGNYLLAVRMLEQSEELLPDWVVQRRVDGPALTEEQCAARLAYTTFDRHRIVSDLLKRSQRAPFTNQSNHQERMARLAARLESLEQARETPAILDGQYREAIRLTPADPWLHYGHALLLAEVGDLARAADELQLFLSHLPQDVTGREKLSGVLAEDGRLEQAIVECRLLIEKVPHFAKPYFTMAFALASLGRFDESIAVYKRLLQVDPASSSRIYNEIGRIQIHDNRPQDAIRTYREAIEHNQRHDGGPIPDVYFNYGFALNSAGSAEEARIAYRRAADLYGEVASEDGATVAPLLAAGNALVEIGDFDQASARFRVAVSRAPLSVDGHLGLVGALALAGKTEEAETAALRGVGLLQAAGLREQAEMLRKRIETLDGTRPDRPTR